MKIKWMGFVVAVILLIALVGCGDKSAGSEEASDDPIKLGFSALPTWYVWYLVEEKGFFEDHEVDVELKYFSVYGDSISALNAGEIDGNSQTLLDSIPGISKGIDLKSVFITDTSNGGDGLVVTPDINSVEDLNGKKVGTEIGTIAHFFLLTILEDYGMTESDVNFTNLAVQDAGTAFIAGNLDAAELWEPFLSKAINEGKGKALVTSADYPGLIADLFVMREEITEERPEDVEAITAAWFDAVDYLKENPEESVKIIAKAAEISEEDVRVGLEGFKLFSPEENLSSYEEGDTYESLHYTGIENAEFLKGLEFIDEVPDLSEFIDNEFVEKQAE